MEVRSDEAAFVVGVLIESRLRSDERVPADLRRRLIHGLELVRQSQRECEVFTWLIEASGASTDSEVLIHTLSKTPGGPPAVLRAARCADGIATSVTVSTDRIRHDLDGLASDAVRTLAQLPQRI